MLGLASIRLGTQLENHEDSVGSVFAILLVKESPVSVWVDPKTIFTIEKRIARSHNLCCLVTKFASFTGREWVKPGWQNVGEIQ